MIDSPVLPPGYTSVKDYSVGRKNPRRRVNPPILCQHEGCSNIAMYRVLTWKDEPEYTTHKKHRYHVLRTFGCQEHTDRWLHLGARETKPITYTDNRMLNSRIAQYVQRTGSYRFSKATVQAYRREMAGGTTPRQVRRPRRQEVDT